MSSKAQKVIDYYLLCHTLKDTIRTGWQVWNAKRDRLESIAEHIYGVQMLAIAMKSEYRYESYFHACHSRAWRNCHRRSHSI